MLISQSDFEAVGSSHRETVHDLRNLFAVIVSARRLLGKDRASERGEDLLAAIEDAAFRGSQLTTNLLARDAQEAVEVADVGARLTGVAPLLPAQTDPGVEVRAAASRRSRPARLASETFDAAISELVPNLARQAGGRVHIRSRAGEGAVISIVLPMSPLGAVVQSATRSRRGFQGDLH